MKTNKKIHNVIECVVLAVILTFCMQGVVMAAGGTNEKTIELPQAVKEKETGAVKLLIYAVDENNKQYNIRQGMGILIGTKSDSGQETEFIIAGDEFTQVDDTILNNIRLKYGLSPESSLDVYIDVVLQVGTRIQAETQGEGEGFVILGMLTDINGISSLCLGNSEAVNVNDRLYMLGYSGNNNLLGQEKIKNQNLERMTGTVSSTNEEEIVTDFQLQEEYIGMPVLDAEGYVIGMVVKGEEEVYIQPIDKIKSVLEVLGIQYKGVDTATHYNEVTDDIKEKLNKVLYECQRLVMETDKFTGKSIDKLKNEIDTAMGVIANADSTYDDYESAIEGLEEYKDKLRNKDYSIHLLQITLAVLIVLFMLLGTRTRFVIRQLQEESKYNLGGLMGENDIIYAKLIRIDTGQEIPISSVFFKIGKNEGNIDYVISDNTSISRHHADIIRKDLGFYIVDNNSTNCTFVNEKRAMPGEQVPIVSGDIIQMSNIRFRFEV
ncbi:MAG: FHA domain-containing protein [Lachnospiraceae bacterium]|nr:FHA domain-containing protein [Lachnospiraceae bacterium]